MNTQYNDTLKAVTVSKHVLSNGMTILVRPIHLLKITEPLSHYKKKN